MLPSPNTGLQRRRRGKKDKLGRKDASRNSAETQDIKLHQSENAWIPSRKMKEKFEGCSQNLETESLKRNVQSVLNKLTFQKFKILLAHLKELNICSEKEMDLVAELIYENAIYEPHFSVLYANLVKDLSKIQMPSADKLKEQTDFITVLLSKCQIEFEKHCNAESKQVNEERNDTIGVMSDKEMELTCKYDKKIKARRLGNIRFIGELFKLNLILKPVLIECIDILLVKQDDESLECLCLLIKTAGKELERHGNLLEKNEIEECFVQIQKIVDEHLTSTRIRFLLKDILDLRKNNWIPRRVENVPRTIDEIHQEAALEARKQWQWYQNMMYIAAQSDKQDQIETDKHHNACLCASEKPSTSKYSKKNVEALNQPESNLKSLDEAKQILAATDASGRNKSARKRVKKKKSPRGKPGNKTDSPDSGSKSLP